MSPLSLDRMMSMATGPENRGDAVKHGSLSSIVVVCR
jgi:hypothetical protein